MLIPQDVAEGSSTETIELRSRNARNSGDHRIHSDRAKSSEKVIIEKKMKPGDSLNKIALQYSVSVFDLKRANNIVSEQDIYALPYVKIPVSKLRKELDFEHERGMLRDDNSGRPTAGELADDRPLLGSGDSSDKSVEELFEKTDASIAQVRSNLPSDAIDGAFHFVDASSPDTTFRGLWFILVFVIFIFIFVPLILTFVEEEQTEYHDAKKSSMEN